jgi:hypothetical protein
MTCTCSSPTAAGLTDGRLTMLAVGDTVHAVNCWAARTAGADGGDLLPDAWAVRRARAT